MEVLYEFNDGDEKFGENGIIEVFHLAFCLSYGPLGVQAIVLFIASDQLFKVVHAQIAQQVCT